ncbi:hypothetical protein [Alcanivorax sp.]|jgi:hypothetical protein|uniref:hypothetical protein n=1 Tax=Alcanivorax sp. TaxID=1872427 RepID=UPI0032D99D97
MDFDDIFDDGLVKGAIRILVKVLRALLFIGWNLLFEVVGWTIGWPVWRILTLGKFPKEHIRNHEDAPWATSLIVDLTGLAILAGIVAWLSHYV